MIGIDRDFVKTTCPRDCYDACGVLVVRENGRIRKVLGDPDHHVARGSLCGKCAIAYNGAWRDRSARLHTPLRRTGAKGAGSFEATSWDEALGTIAKRLNRLIDGGRSRSIVHTHYTGTVALLAGWYPLRFFNRIGATEIDPDTVCNKAGHSALEYVFGNSLEGFDPESAADSACILVWGANPSHSAPHMHKHWLRETKAAIIAIDPIAHTTAREVAAHHLQLRPGTDAALAFGLLHVAERAGLLDRDFIAAHVLGFEEIEADIARMTPAETEHMTGVPAALIEQVGEIYAKGPSLLWMGQGMQRTRRGGNAFRALAALVAGTGNIAKPGAGFCYMNGPASRGIDMDLVVPPGLAAEGNEAVSHMDMVALLSDPQRADAFLTWNNNPVASSPDQAGLRRALAREDLFQVSVELFRTDTTDYADFILPAASFLEFDDIVAPYFHHTLSAQVKAEDPPGEAFPNQEIFRRLAHAMGLTDAALFESDADLLDRLTQSTPFGGSFAELAAAGTVRLYDAPRIQFADKSFPTPSGRIEIASAAAAADGLPRLPEPHADAPPSANKLRILSPASRWQMNSSYGNDEGVLRQLGEASVLLHPADAGARGIRDGASVTLSNAAGELTLKARLAPETQPGTAIVYKGRWPRLEGTAANVNILHTGVKSDIGESTCVHSIEAELTLKSPEE